jgi:ABC-type tungstate transport system substrate-binding protein
LNVPDTVGVPLIVIIFPAQVAFTPVGKPEAVPIPVAPVVVCVIFGDKAVLIHKVGVDDAAPTVLLGLTIKLLLTAGVVPHSLVTERLIV